jgi:hypothetical protein
MATEMNRTVGNVRLAGRSNSIPDQPDEESDYIVDADVPGTHLSKRIHLTKPGSAQAALDLAARDPWVIEHSGLSS